MQFRSIFGDILAISTSRGISIVYSLSNSFDNPNESIMIVEPGNQVFHFNDF